MANLAVANNKLALSATHIALNRMGVMRVRRLRQLYIDTFGSDFDVDYLVRSVRIKVSSLGKEPVQVRASRKTVAKLMASLLEGSETMASLSFPQVRKYQRLAARLYGRGESRRSASDRTPTDHSTNGDHPGT
ncbi:MAG TPA: hypothetical protein PKE16_11655 [Hyphomicrobium sp.]|nr:hypothetical protein [Hyphomicrobium sp.]